VKKPHQTQQNSNNFQNIQSSMTQQILFYCVIITELYKTITVRQIRTE